MIKLSTFLEYPLLNKNPAPGSRFKTFKENGVFPIHIIGAPDGGEWLTSHPSHFTQGNHPLNRRLGGPHNQSGHFGEANNLLPLPAFEPQTPQPTAYSLLCSIQI
jgi:hypothetical protein